MSEKKLMRGNDALSEAAIRAGCRYYFGYPITPQNEVPAYMSRRMPEVDGVYVQAESELAAINMVFGAGATGARAMTSSSSPGISLMQEGISYIAAAQTPAVIVNIMRGGPGLGNIAPSQADYLQAVKGGGHGDYNCIVIAPNTVQELADSVYKAFDLAQKYRNPVIILGDGILGQMSEPVILPDFKEVNDEHDWAICNGTERSVIKSLYLRPENQLELINHELQEKYEKIKEDYVEYDEYMIDDADYLIIAYGTTSRTSRSAIDILKKQGIKVGLFRPISLWPFPEKELLSRLSGIKQIFVFEMAKNQLEQDVRLIVEGQKPIKGFYKLGGAVFDEHEISNNIMNFIKG